MWRWSTICFLAAAWTIAPIAASQAADPPTIRFAQQRYDDVREGYVTLSWSDVDSAAGYQVVDADNRPVYSGLLPEAFISGLPDGEHHFRARAFDVDGQEIASSNQQAIVAVHHWSLVYALVLFALGVVVVLSVLFVIVQGAWGHGGQRA